MSQMIYSTIASLDGYNADASGNFDWAYPGEQVLAFINDQEEQIQARGIPTYLYGRRMYQMMAGWETNPAIAAQSPESEEFAALWRRAHKVVFSTTLERVWTTNTELRRSFEPAEVQRIKDSSAGDVLIDGPTLAAHGLRAGLVDGVQLYLTPVIIGDGNPVYPADVRLDLELLAEQRFANGMVFLRYAVRHG